MSRNATNGYTHTADELVAIVDSRHSAELIEAGFTDGHGAGKFAIGEVVYAHVRGALRACKVSKLGRANITVECTTVTAINEAARYGWAGPCLTAKIVKAAEVFRKAAEVVEAEVAEPAGAESATVVETSDEVKATEPAATTVNREAWLAGAVELLRPVFEPFAAIPTEIAVSVGWPGGKSVNKVIGQCWPTASGDGVSSLYISPRLVDPVEVLGVLVHELVHAVDDCASGHKGAFRRIATALGLEGKMTATTVGDELRKTLEGIAGELGAYPHRKVTPNASGIRKQTTRMIKVECAVDGYVARTTRKWLDELGAPSCPCGQAMAEVA